MTQEEFLIALGNNQGNSNEVVGEDISTTADYFPSYNNLYFPPSYNKGRPREGIDSLYNYDLVDAQTIDEQNSGYFVPEEQKKNIFASIIDLMSQGGIGRVLADSFRNKVTNTPSMQAWRNFNVPQYTAAAKMYQPGGVLEGYNPVSMFGKGPLGSLQSRADAMIKRRDAKKSYSQANLNKVMRAIGQLESNPANVGRAPSTTSTSSTSSTSSGTPRHHSMAKGGIAGLRG
mgnify:CR=1 FL=1